uniref:Uncharacterized protein n=1 Tax=Cacopsylla melanoneura TaxID=428564 RepID=A0A8D8U1R7_9HEMI
MDQDMKNIRKENQKATVNMPKVMKDVTREKNMINTQKRKHKNQELRAPTEGMDTMKLEKTIQKITEKDTGRTLMEPNMNQDITNKDIQKEKQKDRDNMLLTVTKHPQMVKM